MNLYLESLKRLYPSVLSTDQCANAITLNLISAHEYYSLIQIKTPDLAVPAMKSLVGSNIITANEFKDITGIDYYSE